MDAGALSIEKFDEQQKTVRKLYYKEISTVLSSTKSIFNEFKEWEEIEIPKNIKSEHEKNVKRYAKLLPFEKSVQPTPSHSYNTPDYSLINNWFSYIHFLLNAPVCSVSFPSSFPFSFFLLFLLYLFLPLSRSSLPLLLSSFPTSTSTFSLLFSSSFSFSPLPSCSHPPSLPSPPPLSFFAFLLSLSLFTPLFPLCKWAVFLTMKYFYLPLLPSVYFLLFLSCYLSTWSISLLPPSPLSLLPSLFRPLTSFSLLPSPLSLLLPSPFSLPILLSSFLRFFFCIRGDFWE